MLTKLSNPLNPSDSKKRTERSDINQCDEEQGTVYKQVQERRQLRDQVCCSLERSLSRMSLLAFNCACMMVNYLGDFDNQNNVQCLIVF